MIDPRAEDEVRGELRPGERIVWAERPSPRVLRHSYVGLATSGVVLCVFVASGRADDAEDRWAIR